LGRNISRWLRPALRVGDALLSTSLGVKRILKGVHVDDLAVDQPLAVRVATIGPSRKS